jgi:hypothetical protein
MLKFLVDCYKPGRTKAVKERETNLEESGTNSRDPGNLC